MGATNDEAAVSAQMTPTEPEPGRYLLRAASHIMFCVRDVAVATRFYADVLGMKVLSQNDGWADIDAGAVKLSLSRAGTGEPCGSGSAEIVFGVHDAAATAKTLAGRGAQIDVEPTPICSTQGKTYRWARVRDPDGNLVSFYSLE